MSVLEGTRRKLGLAALMVTMFAAAAIPGQAADTSRCGGTTNEVDPVTGDPVDPTVVIIGVNAPTEGDDVIFGSDGSEVINGLGGNDVICAFGGGDTIDGGTGADTVYGGDGDDRIHGNDG